ncbi:MAG: carboxypeptidase regulatory-like domain-containing protein [Acidobacteria bacterium]|nr:MAG: carboxypeptidase regulatory-like domain-containing protein [Acidobacteriota bacterium]REK02842.1 MAG: carboxypeptidase regulatory-like domain-containing protein [Acidobacteriota bacterium]REK13354.1 MAG: carboxypeptidase regulatory-like domain-containing protein [Acidobacteriota bacterium]REK41348.1 MAG: carboxypeptidase regulatory-like domain-containing protein [Acidobacteriota bacterium]
MKRCLGSVLFILTVAALAFAQTTTGRLLGNISGPDGLLPGATVTAKDNNTGKEVTTTSSDSGSFIFPQLEFGTYTVTVVSEGFKTFVATDVKIDVGREYTLNPTLEVGDVQESVTVTAGAEIVTASTAQISNTVSPQQILSLPLITRNPLSLTTLQAGVASNSAQNTTINGMRTTFTNITRDGINIQDTFIRSNATDFAPGRPSVDDTGEFTIATANAEADQGYGGAQIRLVTPRGESSFHGALFAYNRNSEFAANSFFNNRNGTARQFRNRNQFGGKLSGPVPLPHFGEGGPLWHKDKGFFFFAYEGIRDPQTSNNNLTRTILTDSARNGAFSWARTNSTSVTPFCPSQTIGSICTIPDILGYARANVANGSEIPATISPLIQSRVLSQLPTTSNFTGGDGLNTAGFRATRASTQERNQYSSRFDIDFDEKNSFLAVFNYNRETNLRPDADTTSFGFTPGVTQASANKQFTAAYRRTFTQNFTTEFRGGIFTSEVPFDRTDPRPDYFLALPLVTFPENTFMDQGRNTKGINFQSNSDLILGKHSIRFGAQAQIFKVNSYNDAGLVPTITVGTGTATPAFTSTNFSSIGGISSTQLGTANGLLALLGGGFTTAAQSFNVVDLNSGFEATRPVTPFRYENHSFYIADKWNVVQGLQLSLGLRYEIFPALRLINGLALEPVYADINNPIPSLLDINGMTDVIGGNAGRENAYYKTDWNNLAPNIGVAYTPSFENGVGRFLFGESGKSVIRGGYSHAYGNDSIVTSINNAAVGNPGLARTTFSQINLNGRLDAGVPSVTPGAFVAPPRSYLLNNRQNNFFGTIFGIDPNLETPKVEQYSLGFQREFFGNTAFEIRYVGSRSNNLARGIDLNQIDIFSNGFLADFERARANFNLTGNAFCVSAGCQPLNIFINTNNPQPGRLVVGTGGLSATTFNNHLNNGTVADLAAAYINNSANLNNHPSSLNPTAVPRINFLPNPAGGAVDYFFNDAEYQYDSLQLEVRRRFSDGLYFQANYTFSKNLTNAVGTSQNLFEPYLDNNNKDLDRQRADFDQTHVFNFNGVYQLPFGSGKQFLNYGGFADKILGGWEISGLAQWTSGAPITFVDTRGTLNRSARSARQTVNSSLTNQQIAGLQGIFEANGNIYWIDPAVIGASGAASNGFGSSPFAGQVFFNTNPGQTGNLGRTLIDGPSYFNINAAVLKNITFGERMRVQLRAEAFNVLNNTNFIQNTQFANINSTSFGQITSAFAPREIQFAARFEF